MTGQTYRSPRSRELISDLCQGRVARSGTTSEIGEGTTSRSSSDPSTRTGYASRHCGCGTVLRLTITFWLTTCSICRTFDLRPGRLWTSSSAGARCPLLCSCKGRTVGTAAPSWTYSAPKRSVALSARRRSTRDKPQPRLRTETPTPNDNRTPDTMRDLLNDALWLFDDETREPRLFGPGRPSTRTPPPEPGLYRLIRRDTGEIWYIGQASDLADRIQRHRNAPPHVAAWKAIGTCFTEEAYYLLLEKEREQIARHDPEGNRSSGGEGRPPRFEECMRPVRRCRHPGECKRWES